MEPEVVDLILKEEYLENEATRMFLTAPDYAPIVAMRGEIRMGTMKSRVVMGRLQYQRRKMQRDT